MKPSNILSMSFIATVLLLSGSPGILIQAATPSTVLASESRWLHQGDWTAKWSGDQLTLTQELEMVSVKERSQPLTYRVVNQKGDVLQEQPASFSPNAGGSFRATVTFNLQSFKQEPYLYLEVAYKGKVQKFHHQSKTPAVFEAGRTFQLASKDDQLMLLNQSRAHLTYQTFAYFSEQLHLTVKESEIQTYQLRRVGVLDERGTVESTIDQNIDLRFLEEGQYYVYLNQLPVHVTQNFNQATTKWYTVTRNGESNRISLSVDAGMLVLNVEKVAELPESVYDLILDPGHGGTDPGAVGNGATEAEEVLKVSQYLAERFEAHGLKVKLTRETSAEPGGTTCEYDQCPYVQNGRIEQVYATQAKYVISSHLNASVAKQSKGSEVYSSVFTSDRWSAQILEEFRSVNRQLSDVKNNPARVSEASYKRGFTTTTLDFYYMLRESGGTLTKSMSLAQQNPAYPTTPNYGAETVIVEYAYIDHAEDYRYWRENWSVLGELVVKATVKHLGIPYQSPPQVESN